MSLLYLPIEPQLRPQLHIHLGGMDVPIAKLMFPKPLFSAASACVYEHTASITTRKDEGNV